MTQSKFIGRSKTLIGLVLVLAPILSDVFGYNWSEADNQALGGALESLSHGVGAVLVVWGRLTAKAPLHVKPKMKGN